MFLSILDVNWNDVYVLVYTSGVYLNGVCILSKFLFFVYSARTMTHVYKYPMFRIMTCVYTYQIFVKMTCMYAYI